MIIFGKKKEEWTKEKILSYISEYDIYRWYIGEDFKINKAFCNPFRGDTHPSFIIGNKYSRLTHIDFGDDRYRGDCFSLVMQKYNCSFPDAIQKIIHDFNLGEGKNISNIITWENPKIIYKKSPTDIKVIARKFNSIDLAYWAKYYQNIDDLKEENIFVPKTIYINGKKMSYPTTELIFCYFFPSIEKWKIYRPFASKREKWLTNCPFDYIEHLDKLDSWFSLLAKSKKDRLVLKKALGINSIYTVQAEDPATISEESMNIILSSSTIKYAVCDNDAKGTSFSWWLTNKYNFRHVNVPYNLFDKEGNIITDFAHLAEDRGLDAVAQHFINKGII